MCWVGVRLLNSGSSGGAENITPEMQATLEARRAERSGFGARLSLIFVDPLIELLEEAAGKPSWNFGVDWTSGVATLVESIPAMQAVTDILKSDFLSVLDLEAPDRAAGDND